MTRQEYLEQYSALNSDQERTNLHRKFYGEIINAAGGPRAIHLPFPLSMIRDALKTDENINNLPLKAWDREIRFLPSAIDQAFHNRGDYLTLGNGVCILKEAARMRVTCSICGTILNDVELEASYDKCASCIYKEDTEKFAGPVS